MKHQYSDAVTSPEVNLPSISINRLGIASHQYLDSKGRIQDFGMNFFKVLDFFDTNRCDSVLFSSYTLRSNRISKTNTSWENKLKKLSFTKNIFFEELISVCPKTGNPECLYHNLINDNGWQDITVKQQFGVLNHRTVAGRNKAANYVNYFGTDRVANRMGLMLCGEINIVYRASRPGYYHGIQTTPGEIYDIHNFLRILPNQLSVILNPSHSRMGGYMAAKRRFLSSNNKTLVSVWNKDHFSKAQKALPWAIYSDGINITKNSTSIHHDISNNDDLTLGVINFTNI